jgi:hypothetical protein
VSCLCDIILIILNVIDSLDVIIVLIVLNVIDSSDGTPSDGLEQKKKCLI